MFRKGVSSPQCGGSSSRLVATLVWSLTEQEMVMSGAGVKAEVTSATTEEEEREDWLALNSAFQGPPLMSHLVVIHSTS